MKVLGTKICQLTSLTIVLPSQGGLTGDPHLSCIYPRHYKVVTQLTRLSHAQVTMHNQNTALSLSFFIC